MKRIILVLPINDCAAFNAALYAHDPSQGETFIGSSLLSATGALPATHAMASSYIDDEVFEWISAHVEAEHVDGQVVEWDNIANPSWPWVELLPSLGLKQVSGDE